MKWRGMLETLTITLAAMGVSCVLFALFMLAFKGVSPLALYDAIYVGGFGRPISWMNTLTRAAPLLLTALCTALPARLGIINIGGEGALLAGGLAAAMVGVTLSGMPAPVPQLGMAAAGMVVGGALIALAGALKHLRGVNATISSLLLTYIALGAFNYLVEGPWRESATSNKPSTPPIGDNAAIGSMFGLDIHWGLAVGVVACLLAYVLMDHTTFGFAARMAGGNLRAAQGAGLPVGRLILITCLLAGACAGLAGAIEIGAVHKQANAALYAPHYGFTGILVAFIARQQPLAIIPAAILFGGLSAASATLQSRLGLPDASLQVLMGMMFVLILLFDTLYGRFRVFQPLEMRHNSPAPASRPVAPAA